MTNASYDSWIWFQLNPEDRQHTGRPVKSDGVYICRLQEKEPEKTQIEKDAIEREHLEKHGIYF